MPPEAPDPKTFTSWEDAFEYPIPAVRGMEKQLRRDIDSNREKLRTLVGASYRDLLGTAESIISMDTQMQNVETYMGEIGKRCNTRLIEKKSSNLKTWINDVEAPNGSRYSFVSHLAVLKSCPDVISRLLKAGGSLLLAAKVLVISRLLHTKLSQRAEPPPYLEVLRDRLGTLRRRLLNRIDRRFKRLDIARNMLVETMCAFSLATSSSVKDVVRHFHHMRQEAMSEAMGERISGHKMMLATLRLYVKTLRDTQAVSPNQLSSALERLKSISILRDQEVHSLVELNLELHEQWIDPDVRTFIPYIRHDDLSKIEAERLFKDWARKQFSAYLDGLRERIEEVQDPPALILVRQQIIELWLSNHQYVIGVDSTEALDGLRGAFNRQAVHIVQSRASRLDRVVIAVQGVLQDWHPDNSSASSSLWDSSMTSVGTNKGGKTFRENLSARSLGKNKSLSLVSNEYNAFLEDVESVETMIRNLREIKWTDDFDDVDAEDDLLDNKQVLLSEDDPGLIQEKLSNALDDAYARLQKSLGNFESWIDNEYRGQRCCFLLRTWRVLGQHLPHSYQNAVLGMTSIPELQQTNAEEVVHSPLQKCSIRFQRITRIDAVSTRSLWEGDPQSPVLPSLWTYRFLLDLVNSMAACGSDIWSPKATDMVKRQVMAGIVPLIEKLLDSEPIARNGHVNGHTNGFTASGEEEPGEEGKSNEITAEEEDSGSNNDHPVNGSVTNGHEDSPQPSTRGRDIKIQTLFDLIYLDNATSTKDLDAAKKKWLSLQNKLIDDLSLETKYVERVKRNAAEYWKRTSLLFGLLA